MKKYIFILVLPLFFLSCDLSDSEDISRAQIVNTLRDIEYIFNGTDSVQQKHDKIMKLYHEGCTHLNAEVNINNFWALKINDYTNIKIEDISINSNDGFESASARLKFTFFDRDNQPNGPYLEPALGIISQFRIVSGNWSICGN